MFYQVILYLKSCPQVAITYTMANNILQLNKVLSTFKRTMLSTLKSRTKFLSESNLIKYTFLLFIETVNFEAFECS